MNASGSGRSWQRWQMKAWLMLLVGSACLIAVAAIRGTPPLPVAITAVVLGIVVRSAVHIGDLREASVKAHHHEDGDHPS
jgi:hypothetical protein